MSSQSLLDHLKMNTIDDIITHPKWTQAQEDIITAPYDYLSQTNGKNLRSMLIEQFNEVMRVCPLKIRKVEEIIGILHTSSLLIDDIEDRSILRRGKPTAHLVFGEPYVINTSNYMYFQAFRALAELTDDKEKSNAAINCFNEELLNLHRGQSLDLYWRDSQKVPCEEDYINMVMNKTGGLFRLSIRLMNIFSDVEINFIPLTNLLGVIYQIKDDYLNLKNEVLQKNKGFCEDISEGKISFPILFALTHLGEDDRDKLLNILRMKTNNDEIKKRALMIMDKTDTFQYTKDCIELLREKAIELCHELISDKVIVNKFIQMVELLASLDPKK